MKIEDFGNSEAKALLKEAGLESIDKQQLGEAQAGWRGWP